MGRPCAKRPEVRRRGDQAPSEVLLPDPVHQDAREEGIGRIGDRGGQVQAPASPADSRGLGAGQDPEEAPRRRLPGLVGISPDVDLQVGGLLDVGDAVAPRRFRRHRGGGDLGGLLQGRIGRPPLLARRIDDDLLGERPDSLLSKEGFELVQVALLDRPGEILPNRLPQLLGGLAGLRGLLLLEEVGERLVGGRVGPGPERLVDQRLQLLERAVVGLGLQEVSGLDGRLGGSRRGDLVRRGLLARRDGDHGVLCGSDDAGQRIVVERGNRIELVIVAAGAAYGEAQEGPGQGVDPIVPLLRAGAGQVVGARIDVPEPDESERPSVGGVVLRPLQEVRRDL